MSNITKTLDKAFKMLDESGVENAKRILMKNKNYIDYTYGTGGRKIPKNPNSGDVDEFIRELGIKCTQKEFRQAWRELNVPSWSSY